MQNEIFIITINYNQSKYTADCVASLLDSTQTNFKAFVLDNGSSEINYNLLTDLLPKDNRIILERVKSNLGYVGGINFALNYGKNLAPNYYVILNNDTIVDKTSLAALLKTIKKYNDRAIVAGKVYEMDTPEIIQTIGTKFTNRRYLKEYSPGKGEVDCGKYEKEEEMDIIDDILWIMPANIIEEVGLYSKFFYYGGEQADFVLRAKAKGYKLIYTPESKIWHKGGATYITDKKVTPEFVYHATYGSIIFQYRNTTLSAFIFIIIKVIAKALNKLLFIKGSKELQRAKLKGVFAAIKLIVTNIKTIRD